MVMIRHRSLRRLLIWLLLVGAVAACSGDDDTTESAPSSGSTRDADRAAVEAALLPASGPMQAGTYASPAFDPMLTLTLERGWTVSSHIPGGLFLSYEDDPGATAISAVGISRVTGVYDTPFLTGDQVRDALQQQSHVRPIPDGDLIEALDALPGTTLEGRERVEVAGFEGTRFTLEIDDLPEARQACPDGPPRGCFWAFDLPGLFGNLLSPGDVVDMTTFTIDDDIYVVSTATPADGPAPAGFEAAASGVIDSLAFGADVELDEDATLELFIAGLADSSARAFALAVTAPDSAARAAMSVLEADATRLAAVGGPPAIAERTDNADGSITVAFPSIPGLTFDDFEFENGLVSSYTANGVSIGERSARFDEVDLVAGPLRLEGIGTYRSPSNGVLWVTFEVHNGSELVDATGVTATHVAPDGTETATSTPLDVVPPFWSLPFTLQFPDAPSDGRIVFGGALAGQPLAAELVLPATVE
jgi:hypothetical protein